MIKLYLITGFLGAGKTTFLKNFFKYFSDKRIAIIVNEFGKVGIDGALLSTLKATVSEINNGSIFCSCKIEMFEEELRKLFDIKPDVIIVETSGLSDPTNIKKIINGQWENSIKYMGSICLIDALNFKKVYSTARVCKKQLAVSEIAIINKCDLVKAEDIQTVKEIILSQRPNIKLFETTFGEIRSEWIENIEKPSNIDGDKSIAGDNSIHTMDLTLRKYLITIKESFSYYDFVKFLEMFIEDSYRIKGFVRLEQKNYLVDCVGNIIRLEPVENTTNVGEIVILSGSNMSIKQSLDLAVSWYCNDIVSLS